MGAMDASRIPFARQASLAAQGARSIGPLLAPGELARSLGRVAQATAAPLLPRRSLESAVSGKVVVMTGASYGIGRAAALQVAAAGATTVVVARGADQLTELAARDRRGRRRRAPLRDRPLRHGGDRRARRAARGGRARRRHSGEQRGPLDPPLDRRELRPLPRLRAHDAAELLRRRAAHARAAPRHARAAAGSRRQREHARGPDDHAALLRLPRLEGRARGVHARRRRRVPGRRRALHDRPHAACAHADEPGDEALRRDARGSPPRPPAT